MAKKKNSSSAEEKKGVLQLDGAVVRKAAIEGASEAPSDGDGNAKARVYMFSGSSHTKTFYLDPTIHDESEQIETAIQERNLFIDMIADLISDQEPTE